MRQRGGKKWADFLLPPPQILRPQKPKAIDRPIIPGMHPLPDKQTPSLQFHIQTQLSPGLRRAFECISWVVYMIQVNPPCKVSEHGSNLLSGNFFFSFFKKKKKKFVFFFLLTKEKKITNSWQIITLPPSHSSPFTASIWTFYSTKANNKRLERTWQ